MSPTDKELYTYRPIQDIFQYMTYTYDLRSKHKVYCTCIHINHQRQYI